MAKYKITGGEMRLLATIFEHLKPYSEQVKNKRSVALDDGEEILETYYGLLARALAARLDVSERTLIKKRYGLSADGKCYTLEEIAQEFSVTRERIRQAEAKALSKIKQCMTELNDEETDKVIHGLQADAQGYLVDVAHAREAGDSVSGDVYTNYAIVSANAMNKLKIQQEMRKFKEKR